MFLESFLGFSFMLAWAFGYLLMARQGSVAKALLGVFFLFGALMLFNRYRFRGELFGWFIGIIAGFFTGLWLVQKYGPEKPTEGSAVALFLFGPLILALLLVLALLF